MGVNGLIHVLLQIRLLIVPVLQCAGFHESSLSGSHSCFQNQNRSTPTEVQRDVQNKPNGVAGEHLQSLLFHLIT